MTLLHNGGSACLISTSVCSTIYMVPLHFGNLTLYQINFDAGKRERLGEVVNYQNSRSPKNQLIHQVINKSSRAQCYTTFYVRNLRRSVLRKSQAFPAKSNVCK